VLHHAIGEGEEGRCVVELDEAGKGRLPREHDGRRVDGVDSQCRERKRGIASARPPGKREPEPGDGERYDERNS
jgi:hypothetical protein